MWEAYFHYLEASMWRRYRRGPWCSTLQAAEVDHGLEFNSRAALYTSSYFSSRLCLGSPGKEFATIAQLAVCLAYSGSVHHPNSGFQFEACTRWTPHLASCFAPPGSEQREEAYCFLFSDSSSTNRACLPSPSTFNAAWSGGLAAS